MLKGIPQIISPELMKTLMQMGHGDQIVIADGNYPVHSQGVPVIRADGHGVIDILEAILELMPLDTYSEHSVSLMGVGPDRDYIPEIWAEFKQTLQQAGHEQSIIEVVDRFDFYRRSERAFAIVATSEKKLYANIILKKGVL